MGADGGSIPKRVEMVKTKKGPLQTGQIDESEILRARWTRCFLSKEPLQKPIVACPLGRLYNKEAVIKFLIDKGVGYDEEMLKEMAHIKSIKSLINCKLTKPPSTEDVIIDNAEYFVCPITLREMNGKCKFYVTRGCGCVLSEPALSQFPHTESCIVCERPDFDAKKDLIPLYPKGEELEALKRTTTLLTNKKRPIQRTLKDDDAGGNAEITEKASLIFEEIKSSAAASGKEIGVLKRSKAIDSLYHK